MPRALLPLLFFAVISCLMAIGLAAPEKTDWPTVKQMIRDEFPEIEQVSAAVLSNRLAAESAPLLLDVREEEEYRWVAHVICSTIGDSAVNQEIKDVLNRYSEKGFRLGAGLGIAIGVSMGIAIGAVFGFSTDNLAVGVAFGIVVGAALGATVDRAIKRSEDSESAKG